MKSQGVRRKIAVAKLNVDENQSTRPSTASRHSDADAVPKTGPLSPPKWRTFQVATHGIHRHNSLIVTRDGDRRPACPAGRPNSTKASHNSSGCLHAPFRTQSPARLPIARNGHRPRDRQANRLRQQELMFAILKSALKGGGRSSGWHAQVLPEGLGFLRTHRDVVTRQHERDLHFAIASPRVSTWHTRRLDRG